MNAVLRMTEGQRAQLHAHLFPGDGREAIALALCGRGGTDVQTALTVFEIFEVPHDECTIRASGRLIWPTEYMHPLLARAPEEDLTLLRVHSHPGGWAGFSVPDTDTDLDVFSFAAAYFEDDRPHVSAIMLPDGFVFGRLVYGDGRLIPLRHVSVVGETIQVFTEARRLDRLERAPPSPAQVFGRGTVEGLAELRIGIVGISGTGSWVLDQLSRLGVGGLVAVDPEFIEETNVPRIANARGSDVGKAKVVLQEERVARHGRAKAIEALAIDLQDPRALRALAGCDVLVGCVDNPAARQLLNRVATFYTLPLFDLGVGIDADGNGGVVDIQAVVHYVIPGGSSVLRRGAFTMEGVQAASLARYSPAVYERLREERYVHGAEEVVDQPAVVSVNMIGAGVLVTEVLRRLHGFGNVDLEQLHEVRINILDPAMSTTKAWPSPDVGLARSVGRGDCRPLLEIPALS